MTTQITYRRTRNDAWVAYGPATAITAGEVVVITRKDGTVSRRLVESVGRSFNVDGVEMVYGYLAYGEMPETIPTVPSAWDDVDEDEAAEIAKKITAAEQAKAETDAKAPAAPARYNSRYRTRPTTGGCKACGGWIDEYDREVAAIPGYHADCI